MDKALPQKNDKLALVLSGGGSRGFAHLGILKALNEYGYYPDMIAGTSAGAIAAVLYADGYSPDETMELFKDKELLKYVEVIIPKTGLLKMNGMVKLLKNHLKANTFEDLKIPIYVAATNINTGKIEYFNSGDIIKPLVASASIPVIFSPVRINDSYYLDGGLLDNFPIKTVEYKASKIIGAFVNHIDFIEEFKTIKDVALRAFQLSVNKNVAQKAQKCDIVIAPKKLYKYGLFDVGKRQEIFDLGYKEAIKVLSAIKKL